MERIEFYFKQMVERIDFIVERGQEVNVEHMINEYKIDIDGGLKKAFQTS